MRWRALHWALLAGAIAASAAAQAAPPDVVLTRDGSMVRGTIVEKRANAFVTIQLITGESRTINAADVTYAGPAAQMPGAQPAAPPPPDTRPLVTVHAGEARLVLTAPEPLGFHVRSGEATIVGGGYTFGRGGGPTVFGARAASYTSICTAPCEASLPAGTHRLALSRQGGTPIEPDQAVELPVGTSELQGRYTSYAGLRVAGWITMIGTLVVGGFLILDARKTETKTDCSFGVCNSYPNTTLDTTKLGLGLGIGLVGPLVGLLMTFKNDEAAIHVARPPAVTYP